MIKRITLITLLLLASFAFSQVCPHGMKWNRDQGKCVKMAISDNMEIVNYKCPNGSSWVAFKGKCLDNSRVKEIYDSLRIEYLKSPKIVEKEVVYVDAKTNEKVAKPSNVETVVETVVIDPYAEKEGKKKKGLLAGVGIFGGKSETPDETEKEPLLRTKKSNNEDYINISKQDFLDLRDEVMSLKEEVTEIKETNVQIQKDIVTFKTFVEENSKGDFNHDGEEVIASMSADEINFLKGEIDAFKKQISDMQDVVNTLQSKSSANNYTYPIGKETDSVSKKNIYGNSEVKFIIKCPKGFKWVNDESICLSADKFQERSYAKASDPNAEVEYGIRDVKCPRNFLWNSKSKSCIPTMHASAE